MKWRIKKKKKLNKNKINRFIKKKDPNKILSVVDRILQKILWPKSRNNNSFNKIYLNPIKFYQQSINLKQIFLHYYLKKRSDKQKK